MDLSAYLRDVPDFPLPGIVFKDIGPLLADPNAFGSAVEAMATEFADSGVTIVAGIEARGFIFGPSIAQRLDAGFAMLRKPGKLPGKTIGVDYDLEYGTDRLELGAGLLDAKHRVLLVDDVLATGGTMAAAVRLINTAGAKAVGVSVLVELSALNGRLKLPDVPISAQLEVN